MALGSIRSVCVYGGASGHVADPIRRAAAALGTALAGHGVRVVFGGGRVGMMGLVADAALAAGGEVVGVIPRFLFDRELGHTGVTSLRVVDSMHERKQTMFELADAFAVLPGGVGTLDETFEVITWRQLGLHDKPIVLLDVDGYWQGFAGLVGHVVAQGFAAPATAALFALAPSVETAVAALAAAPPPHVAADSARL
ncbi:MAG: TIGR00730 family Rossman fold protein [Rhodospirillales bacterium]